MDELTPAPAPDPWDDYPVTCDCGYRGWRFDCQRGECPNCGDRVTKVKTNERGDAKNSTNNHQSNQKGEEHG